MHYQPPVSAVKKRRKDPCLGSAVIFLNRCTVLVVMGSKGT